MDRLPTTAETFLRTHFMVVTLTMLFAHAQTEYDPYKDLHLIEQQTTFLEGRQLCRDLGYDGLAVLRSKQAFQYALTLTRDYRDQKKQLYIGAKLCLSQNKIMWDDGTELSDDNGYWGQGGGIKKAFKPYVYMGIKGDIWMSDNDTPRASLCGKSIYSALSQIPSHPPGFISIWTTLDGIQLIQGTKFEGQQPKVVDSKLTSVISSVNCLLLCVSLCGDDNSCVAVEFNFDLSTCTTFLAGAYSNLVLSPASVTFVKK